ncbi:hypothetical protein ACFRH6_30915 [Streptomyces sp. NPDC056749]|uniref:hypothetical protein n=1 Tax=Streptomyces sp. NPDC056749 TaxID=3345936 RepID=UPI003686664F
MRSGRPVVIAWALLVAGGWAATLWLGEPSATAGPDPAPSAGVRDGDNPAPGPQPEGSCGTARPTPAPSASGAELLKKLPDGYADGHSVLVVCTYSEVRDHAVAR